MAPPVRLGPLGRESGVTHRKTAAIAADSMVTQERSPPWVDAADAILAGFRPTSAIR
ncbi:MAG: hypothetical protein R6U67_09215 [Sodalinema sp.]|uniref:hypothetical protein n=1 Tax=Sodalinema sp. TaxID=3080550 RepID=UPI00396F61A0